MHEAFPFRCLRQALYNGFFESLNFSSFTINSAFCSAFRPSRSLVREEGRISGATIPSLLTLPNVPTNTKKADISRDANIWICFDSNAMALNYKQHSGFCLLLAGNDGPFTMKYSVMKFHTHVANTLNNKRINSHYFTYYCQEDMKVNSIFRP